MIGQMISLALALLGAAAVYGTDVFFCVVGRTALTHVSDGGARRDDGASSRGSGPPNANFPASSASSARSRASPLEGWLWALSAVAAQVVWIVVYRSVAAPVNAELTRQARAHSVPTDARALQARWDSVIVARVLLMGFAVVALAGASSGRRSEGHHDARAITTVEQVLACPRRPGVALLGVRRIHAAIAQETPPRARLTNSSIFFFEDNRLGL